VHAIKRLRFGVTIKTTPKAVIINHDDTLANNALFSKNVNSIANWDKDYISTVLQTQRHMLSVVPPRPDQLDELLDPDGTLRSVRTVSKVFEGRNTAKDSLFRNWLRAAFVAQDHDNNADSTSQLQIEPEFPAKLTVEQSATFYTDLANGFDEENHTFGTAIMDGILNVLHPSFVPPSEPEVINVENDRNVRQRPALDTSMMPSSIGSYNSRRTWLPNYTHRYAIPLPAQPPQDEQPSTCHIPLNFCANSCK
jgi:hypothetical protein